MTTKGELRHLGGGILFILSLRPDDDHIDHVLHITAFIISFNPPFYKGNGKQMAPVLVVVVVCVKQEENKKQLEIGSTIVERKDQNGVR